MHHNNSKSFSLLDKVLIKRGFSQNRLVSIPTKVDYGRNINLVSMAAKEFVSQLPQSQPSNPPPQKLLNTMKRTAESLKPSRSSPRKRKISIYSSKTDKKQSIPSSPIKNNSTAKKLKVKLKSRTKKPDQKKSSDSSAITLNQKQKSARSRIFSDKNSSIDLLDVSKNTIIKKIRYTTSVLRDLQYDLNNVSAVKSAVRSQKMKVIELQKQKHQRWNKLEEENRLLQQKISKKNQNGSDLLNNMTISFFPDTPSNAIKLLSPFQYQINKTYR